MTSIYPVELIQIQQKALFGCQSSSWRLTTMYFVAEDYAEAYYWALRTKRPKDDEYRNMVKKIRQSLSPPEKQRVRLRASITTQ